MNDPKFARPPHIGWTDLGCGEVDESWLGDGTVSTTFRPGSVAVCCGDFATGYEYLSPAQARGLALALIRAAQEAQS